MPGKTKRHGKLKPIPKFTRDAMGNYIVPPTGKPLTSLGEPTPSAANYFPKIGFTKVGLPHYSIAGKYKYKPGNANPGPADYSTSGDLIWSRKFSKLKGRPDSFFDEEAKKYSTVKGPASYNVKYGQFGRVGPKYSIAHKQLANMCTGAPDSSVQPCDSQGFYTPGPNYRPNSSQTRGPKFSFGISRVRSYMYHESPGPADYEVCDCKRGPSYSLGAKLPPPPAVQRTINKDSPAPNTYDIGTTIGRATSVIIATRPEERPPDLSKPSPAAYYTRDLMRCERATTMAYRWFDPEVPVHPGPADHTITDANLKRAPMFSNRAKTKPSYPDALHYTLRDADEIPGPASYKTTKKFEKNDAPAYRIGERLRERMSDNPAPNAYEYEKKQRKDAPAFSMGKRFDLPDSKVSPGPGAYSPHILDANNLKYSMTSRPKPKSSTVYPAPNAYNLQNKGIGDVEKGGITFKSRASPYVYSGFQTDKILNESTSLRT